MISVAAGHLSIDIPVEPELANQLCLWLEAARRKRGTPILASELSRAMLHVALALADCDPKQPTAAQLKYALDLAEKLNVQIPSRAFTDRASMGAFLSLYAPLAARGSGRVDISGQPAGLNPVPPMD